MPASTSSSPTSAGLTRRALLRRATALGLAAATTGGAAAAVAGRSAPPATAEAAGLTPARRRAYAALAALAAASPSLRVDPAGAEERFAAHHAALPPVGRASAEAVLDVLAADPLPAAIARRLDADPRLAARALALAAAGLGGAGEDDELSHHVVTL